MTSEATLRDLVIRHVRNMGPRRRPWRTCRRRREVEDLLSVAEQISRVRHIMVVLRHSRETAGPSITKISVARQRVSATGRDISSPRAAGQREEEIPMPAGGRHAIAEPAGEQACASKMPPGGTARKCAHLCTPGTPPAEAPWSAHPRAPATRPGGTSWPAPPYAPGTPSGESLWPAQPCAPATPPGESSWPPQPHALGTQGDPPRSKALPPHDHGGPTAKLQWRPTNPRRTPVEPKTALPSFNITTPQHHNDDHHPGELRTLIAERSYARAIGPLTDAARRGIVDCVERGMSAELALALEISARYQARSWEYVSRTLQSVLNGSHNPRRERHTARGGRQRRIAAYGGGSDAYIATIRG